MRRLPALLKSILLVLTLCAWPVLAQQPDPLVTGLMEKFSEPAILDTVRTMQAMTSRLVGRPGNTNAAAYLHARLATMPHLTVEYQDDKWRNVVATLKGQDTNSTAVFIVGAHYDSTSKNPAAAPGATDNAAGDALVLELARILSAQRFRHTIKFALWNSEESRSEGAAAYVTQAAAAKEDLRLYLNLDSVCHDPQGRMLLDIMSDKATEAIKELMVTNNTVYNLGFTLQFNRHNCGGDYVPFRTRGFKSVAVHQENHAFQHTPEDTVDKVTTRYAIQIARLYLTVLVPLLEPK